MEYTVTYPEMLMEEKYPVLAMVEFAEIKSLFDDIPKRIAICECENCGQAGIIIYGERHTGEWICNWNVSRALANILLGGWKQNSDTGK